MGKDKEWEFTFKVEAVENKYTSQQIEEALDYVFELLWEDIVRVNNKLAD